MSNRYVRLKGDDAEVFVVLDYNVDVIEYSSKGIGILFSSGEGVSVRIEDETVREAAYATLMNMLNSDGGGVTAIPVIGVK